MQLNFLGEAFNAKDCNEMCDNCTKKEILTEIDVTDEAILILELVMEALHMNTKLSLI